MATYIGSLQIDSNAPVLLGSTLYGICNSSANLANKIVIFNNFDNIVDGITIHVKFSYGNNILTGVNLEVGSTASMPVSGNCVCAPNEIITFTLERNGSTGIWRSHHSVKIEADNDIVTKIAGQSVNLVTRQYVDDIVQGGNSNGTVHYRGISAYALTNGGTETAMINENLLEPEVGDLVVYGAKEFIWVGQAWRELGDESSYALKSHTTDIQSAITWNAGTTPSLGTEIDADDITNWQAGSASETTVRNGILKIKNSTAPSLSYESRKIPNITNVGTTPSLNVASTVVVIP